MAQAKTLTANELRKVLSNLPVNRYRLRNRLMLLMTHWAGMRVGEVAALRISDVRSAEGKVKPEIQLDAHQTKGKHARTAVGIAELPLNAPVEVEVIFEVRD